MAKKIVNINFNSVIKKILLPLDYDSFLEKIQKILNIKSDLISCFEFEYNDKKGEINFNSGAGYDTFIDEINSGTTLTIIYSNKIPDKDIDSCTKSFENFNENINDSDNVNIINIDNNINTDLNINNDLNQNNESNNDSMDNSNMNIIKKKVDYISLLNNNINKKEKGNSNINENNIVQMFISIKIKNYIDFSETYLTFFELCSSCYEYPLENIIYYCLECKIYICEKCEKSDGFNHRHTLLKIQTKEQYNDLIYNKFIEGSPNQSRLKQIYYYLKNYTYIFFSRKRFPELMNKIQIFRETYHILNNINDITLKNALTKANGDFETAFSILKNNNL